MGLRAYIYEILLSYDDKIFKKFSTSNILILEDK